MIDRWTKKEREIDNVSDSIVRDRCRKQKERYVETRVREREREW